MWDGSSSSPRIPSSMSACSVEGPETTVDSHFRPKFCTALPNRPTDHGWFPSICCAAAPLPLLRALLHRPLKHDPQRVSIASSSLLSSSEEDDDPDGEVAAVDRDDADAARRPAGLCPAGERGVTASLAAGERAGAPAPPLSPTVGLSPRDTGVTEGLLWWGEPCGECSRSGTRSGGGGLRKRGPTTSPPFHTTPPPETATAATADGSVGEVTPVGDGGSTLAAASTGGTTVACPGPPEALPGGALTAPSPDASTSPAIAPAAARRPSTSPVPLEASTETPAPPRREGSGLLRVDLRPAGARTGATTSAAAPGPSGAGS